jgi:uncharacterized membrane protein YkvA (DUF1232 family)
MREKDKSVITPQNVGALTQVVRTLRLVWRLLIDPRVSILPKLIIPAAAIYVISPIDLIPDVILGLGQLDDIGVVVLAITMFIEFCPRIIVEEHRRAIAATAGLGSTPDEDIIDGSYREVKDDEQK